MKKLILSSMAVASMSMGAAIAGPADGVYTPYVEPGVREIDFRHASVRRGDDPRHSDSSIGLGFGAGEYWFTKVHLKYHRDGDSSSEYDAVEWENKYQLSAVGQYAVDIGFLANIARPDSSSAGYAVTFGPLFQTVVSNTQINANFLFSRNYHSDFSNPMRLAYQWQARYLMNPKFDFGAQGFGELGKWDDWAPRSEQSHILGPAVFGRLPLAGRQALKYNAAYLFDADDDRHSKTFRMQVEYEF